MSRTLVFQYTNHYHKQQTLAHYSSWFYWLLKVVLTMSGERVQSNSFSRTVAFGSECTMFEHQLGTLHWWQKWWSKLEIFFRFACGYKLHKPGAHVTNLFVFNPRSMLELVVRLCSKFGLSVHSDIIIQCRFRYTPSGSRSIQKISH